MSYKPAPDAEQHAETWGQKYFVISSDEFDLSFMIVESFVAWEINHEWGAILKIHHLAAHHKQKSDLKKKENNMSGTCTMIVEKLC